MAEFKIPSTNNRIEGGVNACLREMLHNHRGLSVERKIKAVFGGAICAHQNRFLLLRY